MITLKELMEAIKRREEELRSQKVTDRRRGKIDALRAVKGTLEWAKRRNEKPAEIPERLKYFMSIDNEFIDAMNRHGNPAEEKEFFIGNQEEIYLWILECYKVDVIANDVFRNLSRREKKEFKKIIPYGYDLRNVSDKRSVLTDYLGKFATGDIWLKSGKSRIGYSDADFQEKRIKESDYIESFIDADSGIFDGFKMVEVFHRIYRKENAIAVTYSDDSAIAYLNGKKYECGSDGIKVYFMSESPKKRVDFNNSCYFF